MINGNENEAMKNISQGYDTNRQRPHEHKYSKY